MPGLRRNPGLVFPVLELPGLDSPATALRSCGIKPKQVREAVSNAACLNPQYMAGGLGDKIWGSGGRFEEREEMGP